MNSIRDYFNTLSNDELETKRAQISGVIYLIARELKDVDEEDQSRWVQIMRRTREDGAYAINIIDEILNERI